MKPIFFILSFGTLALAQSQQKYTTPVPILKQINRHNEDGSYSYGYEAADGSFKIETKYPTGEVHGKYGYIDNEGTKREIEYGASKRGFEPAGTDINVPPPTLNNNNNNQINPLGPDEEDDGQYREDPSIYWKDPKYNSGVRNVASKPAPPVNYNFKVNAAPKQQYFENSVTPAPEPAYRQPAVYQPESRYQPEPRYQPAYNPAYNPEPYYQRRSEQAYSHPAIQAFDINSGSYTINYSG